MATFYANSFGATNPSAFNFNIEFRVVPTLPNNLAANTHHVGGGMSRIDISAEKFNNCTDLYAASVLVHEFMHSYLSSMMLTHQYGDTALFSNFDSTWVNYTRWMFIQNPTGVYWNPDYSHHEFMAGYMVDLMAQALQEFDGDSQNGLEYYWDLAWGSLQGTPTWNHYLNNPMPNDAAKDHTVFPAFPQWSWSYALTATRISQILAILAKEQDNLTGAVGKPNDFDNCY